VHPQQKFQKHNYGMICVIIQGKFNMVFENIKL